MTCEHIKQLITLTSDNIKWLSLYFNWNWKKPRQIQKKTIEIDNDSEKSLNLPCITMTKCDDFRLFHFFLCCREIKTSLQHFFSTVSFPSTNQFLISSKISQKFWIRSENTKNVKRQSGHFSQTIFQLNQWKYRKNDQETVRQSRLKTIGGPRQNKNLGP